MELSKCSLATSNRIGIPNPASGTGTVVKNDVKNLNISNCENCDSLVENIFDPTLKAIAKWRNHPSMLAVASEYKNRANFSFNFVSEEDVSYRNKNAVCLEGHLGERHFR